MNVIYLSRKKFEFDFRATLFISLSRNVIDEIIAINNSDNSFIVRKIVNGEVVEKEIFATIPSGAKIANYHPSAHCVFDSTGGTALGYTASLSNIYKCPLIFDCFDDLRYDLSGFIRIKRTLALALYRICSDVTLYLSPKLFYDSLCIFSSKYLIDNYFNVDQNGFVKPISYTDNASSVLLGNIDERVDFDFLEALLKNKIVERIDIYGIFASVSTLTKYENLSKRFPDRVHYNGSYSPDEASQILSKFQVGILPYNDLTLKKYGVRPDKLLTYISSRLSVLSAGKYGLDGYLITDTRIPGCDTVYLISSMKDINRLGPQSPHNAQFAFSTLLSLVKTGRFKTLIRHGCVLLFTLTNKWRECSILQNFIKNG